MKFDFDECVRQGVEQAMKECELKIGMTLKEAVEKQIPKAIETMAINNDGCFARCPACNEPIYLGNVEALISDKSDRYCKYCGQKLGWSEP